MRETTAQATSCLTTRSIATAILCSWMRATTFDTPIRSGTRFCKRFYPLASDEACFLTATPRNKTAWDVYNQIKLFHQDDKTDLPVDPADLKQYFKLIDDGQKRLPDLLAHILIRRTRNHILRWYGYDSVTHQPVDPSRFREYMDGDKRAYVLVAGKHQFFPKRELETIDYSIEDTYRGLYQELRGYLGKPRKTTSDPLPPELTYARYGLWRYVKIAKQKHEPYASLHRAGSNLRGLVRVLLFKRFESSVFAFQETIRRLLKNTQYLLESSRRWLRTCRRGCSNAAVRIRSR